MLGNCFLGYFFFQKKKKQEKNTFSRLVINFLFLNTQIYTYHVPIYQLWVLKSSQMSKAGYIDSNSYYKSQFFQINLLKIARPAIGLTVVTSNFFWVHFASIRECPKGKDKMKRKRSFWGQNGDFTNIYVYILNFLQNLYSN